MNGTPQRIPDAKLLRYSLNWSESVVQAHRREHARATEFVNKVFAIGPGNVAYFLAKSAEAWKRYKHLVDLAELCFADLRDAADTTIHPCSDVAIFREFYENNCAKRGVKSLTWKQNLLYS